MQALRGAPSVVEPTMVYLPGVPGGQAIADQTGCDFFSVPVELDAGGAKKAVDAVSLADEGEKKLLAKCVEGLKGNIEKGVEFVKNPPAK